MIFRAIKGLEDLISVDVVHPHMQAEGWHFGDFPGATPDSQMGAHHLHQLYTRADPKVSGIVTVPVLWDKQRQTIVNNESSEIIRMFNSAFDDLTGNRHDYYPADLQGAIDEINATVYDNVNNGVYRAGFATTQDAYEAAFDRLFEVLDELEQRLSTQRYLGRQPDHGSRLAPVHHPGALRRGLLRALQVQPPPADRFPEPLGVHP